ncbi:GNAT family N-acetyltransferase [Paractinoplanes lichenicola]|uniref:GNAT family N-acetyltransferase n=1 Tax=Paractinoplanes lichenicola TaxID=2802976 RepID=A0ABS1VV74_9ACTN|nr:GNAT family N-acetyltransferase [Actinoplanes lichenicola]MBL7258374.1 GNAT family N-acetyltransferase [Actinoplanes lichenicola]
MRDVTLVPFTEDLLPAVQVWFTDADVQRWLGGPDWPAREFRIAGHGIGEEFRGRIVLRVHSWVVLDEDGVPVAHIGGDVYDRWYREPGRSMGLAYVVDPGRQRQGYGRSALLAVVTAPETADVAIFAVGIEPENVASVRCATAAGFTPDDPEPDFEGIVYHLRRKADDHGRGVG